MNSLKINDCSTTTVTSQEENGRANDEYDTFALAFSYVSDDLAEKYYNYFASIDTPLDKVVLDTLFSLGFSKNEKGTYLCEEVIAHAVECLNTHVDNATRRIKMDEQTLLCQMKNPYSQFYFDISVNDNDMGMKSFHNYIAKAVNNVNHKAVSKDTIKTIYGKSGEPVNFGERAFAIANYVRYLLAVKQDGNGNEQCIENGECTYSADAPVQYIKVFNSSKN